MDFLTNEDTNMNNRPLESAEIKLNEIMKEIYYTAREFREVSPEATSIIRRTYADLNGLRANTKATDEGDRELLRAYGAYLAEVAKALQSL